MRSPSARARSAAPLPPLVLVLTLVLLAGAVACRSLTGPSRGPVALLDATAKAAPDSLRFGTIEEFRGERLYDFMNGAAVTYLEHHFRTLAAADVFRGEDQAKIELYELATAGDCERLYAALSASSKTPFPAGEAGCTWAGFEPEALFRRGPFLVRILGYAKDRAAAAALLAEVAKALDAQIRER